MSAARASFLARALPILRADARLLGVTAGGSAVAGAEDDFSDLDLVLVCRDGAERAVLAGAPALAARLGPLLSAFTGEHVGEPRLLICLYGPPALHVDLKVLGLAELRDRVEDGLVLWDRDGAVAAATAASRAVWPPVDPQWIEDRFWVWVHYAATKLGRGELLEVVDALAAIRGLALGPLVAARHGRRAQGVRRLELYDPDAAARMTATIGDGTREGCAPALAAAIALYRALRPAAGVEVRAAAEATAIAYLDAVRR